VNAYKMKKPVTTAFLDFRHPSAGWARRQRWSSTGGSP
jgi:aminoglycoside phosphotransferase family enzyme